jgi:diguanylate cyclase (GGDEF)-like protein
MIVRAAREIYGAFQASRLSTKILLIFALLTVVPFVYLGATLDHANSELTRQQLSETLQTLATSQGSEIDGELTAWRRDAALLAASPELGTAASGRGDMAAAEYLLTQVSHLDPSYQWAGLADPGGRVLASARGRAGSRPLRLGAVQAQVVAGRPFVSSLVFGDVGEAPVLFVGEPLPGGMALLEVDPGQLLGLLLPTRLSGQRFGMLLDENGVVIGYTGPLPSNAIYHRVRFPGAPGLSAVRRAGNYGAQPLTPLDMDDLGRLVGSPGRGAGHARVLFPLTGGAVETGYTHLRQRNWAVAVMQDEISFVQPLHQSTLNIVLSFIAAAALIALLVFIVVRVLERSEIQATRDELTALPNRRVFHEIMAREFLRAGRNEAPLSVINLDLDHFKSINDALGHQRGDEVLRAFARILAGQVRSIDVAARYGGEEFVVLLPDTDKEGAVVLAEKVRHALEQARVVRAGGDDPTGPTNVTVSAGVATSPDDGDTPEVLMRRADEAMYLAKALGRNRVVGFGLPLEMKDLGGRETARARIRAICRESSRATIQALEAAVATSAREVRSAAIDGGLVLPIIPPPGKPPSIPEVAAPLAQDEA